VDLLAQSFCDPPKFRTHRNIITGPSGVLTFGDLNRRHLPLLYTSLNRALQHIDHLTLNKELHCTQLAWQALAGVDDALELGGLPLAITLVEIGTQKANFKARFEAFAVFLNFFEMLCAKPVIKILQKLLEWEWNGQIEVDPFRHKILALLDALYDKFSGSKFLAPLFINEFIGRTALMDRHQRRFAASFSVKNETLLDHPYLFSPSTKLAVFEFWVLSNMEFQHRLGWSLRRISRHFWNLGFRVHEPQSAYFGITAERQDILHDVTKAVTGQSVAVLRRPMKVKYAGEQGIDLAGLTSDLLAKTIKADIARCLEMNLLREASGGVWFQEGVDCTAEFYRLGILIGLAVYNGVKSLPLDFPPMFYKKLVGEPLEMSDMKAFDPELYRGWKHLLEDDFAFDDMTFEYTYSTGTEVQTHVLEQTPEGVPLVVTPQNRHQYITALFNAISTTLVASSFDALQTGIESIIPRRVLHFFTSSELQALVAGKRVIDIHSTVMALKQVTVYDGFSPDDWVIRNLWLVLLGCEPAQFERFLDLVTASDRLPASFPANFKLTIFKSGTDEEMYSPPTVVRC
jgi:ubiquitin-protein ligase E3 A